MGKSYDSKMGQSLRAILQLVLIIAALTTMFVWLASDHPDQVIWAIRFAAPAVVGVIIWLLVRNMQRKEILPDLLREIVPHYFERDGLCFAFVPSTINGVCWVQVFFQNRYEKVCSARIVLQPPAKSFWIGRLPLPTINVDIDCDGGAFGTYRTPWAVPLKVQGKTVKCDISCTTKYPSGRGKLLRFREGLRVGAPSSDIARAAVAVSLLLIGVLRLSRPARVRMHLPTGIADQLPPELLPFVKISWRPDLPTGGFPVTPTVTGSNPPA
jgi:hypothetical protein